MHGQLREMAEDHPSIGDIRGQGLFAQIEFVKAGGKEPLAKWPQTPPVLRQLVAEGRKREMSFAVRGNLLVLCPPLIIEQADLAMGLRVLDELLGMVDKAARVVAGGWIAWVFHIRYPIRAASADWRARLFLAFRKTRRDWWSRSPVQPPSRWPPLTMAKPRVFCSTI